MDTISREQIEDKIAKLEAARDQAMAQLNALIGALNMCRELLAVMDAPEEKP
jgi:hypothetical protein